ncbi:hypothetical protein [Peribacillus sp. NPDC056705]|uniref:hypothetical protein n=1 Tax=Peribacillus sp. NPDC056705 TaxID=3345918 RepID=UPI003747D1B1
MSEIDIYIYLIDDKEANHILKFFNETPTGTRKTTTATLEQKKQHIKKIFKSMTPKMIRQRRKGHPDPFYTYINSQNIIKENAESFSDQVLLLNEERKNIPDYIRFINLLLTFPEETRIRLDTIDQNIRKGIDPLNFDERIKTVEELKEFIRKYRSYIGENAPSKIIEVLEDYQFDEYSSLLKKCKDQIKNYDLLRFYNQSEEIYKMFGLPISHAAYIITHQDEEHDILMLLAIEAMYELLKNQSEYAISGLEKKLDEELGKTQDEKQGLENLLKTKDTEILNLETELTKINKSLKLDSKEREEFKKQLNDWELKYNKQEKKFERTLEEHERSETKLKNDLGNQIDILKKEMNIKKIIELERVNKYKTEYSFNTEWGIICLTDYDWVKEIYPELTIVHADSKMEIKNLLNNPDIKTVYLLMKGLSTKQFKVIKQEIEKYNKVYKGIEFESYKEFVEWIGYMKTMERKGVL